MRCITLAEAEALFDGLSVQKIDNELSKRLPFLVGPFRINPDSGAKTALSRMIAGLLEEFPEVVLVVDNWGVWPSSQNLDLFYGYRKSLGESRRLIEVPVHVFRKSEGVELLCILCLGLYFVWDIYICDADQKLLLTFSHDEWMEFRLSNHEHLQLFDLNMKEFGASLLKPK